MFATRREFGTTGNASARVKLFELGSQPVGTALTVTGQWAAAPGTTVTELKVVITRHPG